MTTVEGLREFLRASPPSGLCLADLTEACCTDAASNAASNVASNDARSTAASTAASTASSTIVDDGHVWRLRQSGSGSEVKSEVRLLKDFPLVMRVPKPTGKLGVTEAFVIASILPELAYKLVVLDLRGHALGEEGGAALVSALVASKLEQPNMKTLDLSHNQLGSRTAERLAEYIAAAKSLRSCHLAGNQFGRAGGKALIDSVRQSRAAAAQGNLKGLCRFDVSPNFAGAPLTQAPGVAIEKLLDQFNRRETTPNGARDAPNLWDEMFSVAASARTQDVRKHPNSSTFFAAESWSAALVSRALGQSMLDEQLGHEALALFDQKLATAPIFDQVAASEFGTVSTDELFEMVIAE